MESAKNGLERIITAVDNLSRTAKGAAAEKISEEEKEKLSKIKEYADKFEAAMDDDFNTADAIAAIFEAVKFANIEITEKSSREFAKDILETILTETDILGLTVERKEESNAEIDALIKERQEARKTKNFARADEIRDILKEKGIALEDTKDGVKWKKIR